MRRIGRATFAAIAVLAAGLMPHARAQGPDDIEAPASEGVDPGPVNPGQATDGLAVRANTAPNTVTLPLPAGCDTRTSAIGLSRIVEIDATGGPRFGRSQYKDIDFLKDGEVILTFDDGPLRRYTKAVLDTLDAHCTRATFFSVGRMALADPETLKETKRRGHTIASHTWSHAKLRTLTAAKAKYEIELGNSAVTKALGAPIAPFFRFPYLGDSKAALDYLRSRNMSTFSIEVDSQDFKTRNPGQVLRNVVAQLKVVKKGIILFHDIQPATAGALSSILDALKAGGYRVVHVVSKQSNTTLPEYDAIVDREIARRQLALSTQPLANRAVTWPNAGPETMPPPVPSAGAKDSQPGKAGAGGRPAEKSSKTGPPSPAMPATSVGVALPWGGAGGPPRSTPQTAGPSEAATGPNPELAQPKRPMRKPLWQSGLDDGDPWRIKTLGD